MPTNDPYERMIEQARKRSEADDKVSIEDFAAELGKSVRTLRRWNNRPDAPQRVRRGRRLMYRRADVQHWQSNGGPSARDGTSGEGSV